MAPPWTMAQPRSENHELVGFDGGAITSNAGALLLGATDRAMGLVRRVPCGRAAAGPDAALCHTADGSRPKSIRDEPGRCGAGPTVASSATPALFRPGNSAKLAPAMTA